MINWFKEQNCGPYSSVKKKIEVTILFAHKFYLYFFVNRRTELVQNPENNSNN